MLRMVESLQTLAENFHPYLFHLAKKLKAGSGGDLSFITATPRFSNLHFPH